MAGPKALMRDAVETEIAVAAADLGISSSRFIHQPADLDLLAAIASSREILDRLEVMIVAVLRSDDASWDSIAVTLGVTRQSAHRRLSRRVSDLLESLRERAHQSEYWAGRQRVWRSMIRQSEEELRVLATLEVGKRGRFRRRPRTARRDSLMLQDSAVAEPVWARLESPSSDAADDLR